MVAMAPYCRGMPTSGWTVDYARAHCNCKYFGKFMVCAHLLIAQNRQDLSALGQSRKILDRSRSQAVRSRVDTLPLAHQSQDFSHLVPGASTPDPVEQFFHATRLESQHLSNLPVFEAPAGLQHQSASRPLTAYDQGLQQQPMYSSQPPT